MKKIICIFLGSILTVLGIIGLMLPVIPQIPFLIGGIFCFSIASDKFKEAVYHSKLFKEKIKPHLKKYPRIYKFFRDKGE